MKIGNLWVLAIVACAIHLAFHNHAEACTGISLKSEDGSVVVSRTVEWALSDAQHNRIAIFPRNKSYIAMTPEGSNGMRWEGRYGFVSYDGV